MSLHDIDKHHDRRLEPQPNQRDEVLAKLAKGTQTNAQNKREESTGGKVKITESQIIVNDGTNDRILVGFLKNGF